MVVAAKTIDEATNTKRLNFSLKYIIPPRRLYCYIMVNPGKGYYCSEVLGIFESNRGAA